MAVVMKILSTVDRLSKETVSKGFKLHYLFLLLTKYFDNIRLLLLNNKIVL